MALQVLLKILNLKLEQVQKTFNIIVRANTHRSTGKIKEMDELPRQDNWAWRKICAIAC